MNSLVALLLSVTVTVQSLVVDARGRLTQPLRLESLVELASRESPPLSVIIAQTMKPSQNLYTELLLRTLGKMSVPNGVVTPSERTSVDDGVEAVRTFLRGAGIEPRGQFVMADGSGLSRHNYITANATVRLLTYTDDYYGMSQRDVELARRISAVAAEQGLTADPAAVQSFLVIPGAPVTADVMPFWRAVLGYEPRADSPEEDLVDPHRRNPGFWFEEMDQPRQGGGAIHVAVWVPPEQGEERLAAALAAGGRVVRDVGPRWWTLADADGNEVDIATVAGRD